MFIIINNTNSLLCKIFIYNMLTEKQVINLKKQFEKELKTKLSLKANSKTSEEQLLIKTFKYFDLMSTGYLEISDFRRSLDKLAVSGFDDENINNIFKAYADKSKQIDYKAFSKSLYSNTVIKDRFEDVEYIINKLKKVFKEKGLGGAVSVLSELKQKNEESSIGIVPNEFEKINNNYRLGLKTEEIEKLFFAFYEINVFNYREFYFSIIDSLSEDRKEFLHYCFNVLSYSRRLTIGDLLEEFKVDLHPNYEEENEERLTLEFSEALKTVASVILSKQNPYANEEKLKLDFEIDEETFMKIFRIQSFFYEDDEDFYNYLLSVYQIEELNSQHKNEEEEEETNKKKAAKKQKINEENHITSSIVTDDCPLIDSTQLKTLENLKKKLLKLNKKFFIQLNSNFKQVDTCNTKLLDFDGFSKAIKLTKVNFLKNEISYVFGLFENKNKGTINYDHILKTMINKNYRIAFITKVFKKLEKDSILKQDLSAFYILSRLNIDEHPEVLNGNQNANELYDDFEENLYLSCAIEKRNAGKLLIFNLINLLRF